MFSKKKSYDYFNGFHKFSKYAVAAAEFLDSIIKDFDRKNLDTLLVEMHEIENDCDIHKHAVDAELYRDLAPPIAAEDIIELNHRLDNVVDGIEDILIDFYVYNIATVRPEAITFANIIVKSAKALEVAMLEFKNYKTSSSLMTNLKRIKTLELDADDLYLNILHKLHSEEEDLRQILVWSKIFERFEECADLFEEVGKQMESIIVKNA